MTGEAGARKRTTDERGRWRLRDANARIRERDGRAPRNGYEQPLQEKTRDTQDHHNTVEREGGALKKKKSESVQRRVTRA